MGMTVLINTKPGAQQSVKRMLEQLGFADVQIVAGPYDIIISEKEAFAGTQAEIEINITSVNGIGQVTFCPHLTA